MLYRKINSLLRFYSLTWTDFLIDSSLSQDFMNRAVVNNINDDELKVVSQYFEIPVSSLLSNANPTELTNKQMFVNTNLLNQLETAIIYLITMTSKKKISWEIVEGDAYPINADTNIIYNAHTTQGIRLTNQSMQQCYSVCFNNSVWVISKQPNNTFIVKLISHNIVINYSVKQQLLRTLFNLIEEHSYTYDKELVP